MPPARVSSECSRVRALCTGSPCRLFNGLPDGAWRLAGSRVASPILAFAPVVPVQGVQQLISYVFLNSELHGELAYTSRCHLASCSAHVVHVALQGARRS